jgi:hypothetical protein
MTDTCKTPLVGKQDNTGCCTSLCWIRVCCGLIIERFEDSGEKGIKILVVVESFRVLFYWSFLALFGIGIFLTKAFVTHDHTAIISDVFGVSNICTYLDFPPATYLLPFLYLFPMAFGITYSVVSMFRIWIAYEEERITVLEKKLLWTVHVYFILTLMWFEMIFAVNPDRDEPTTMIIHSLPYLNLKIAWCVLQIGVVHFGARVAWKDVTCGGTWFVTVSWIHVALQCIAMVISNTIILNALLDMGPGQLKGKGIWWSVHDPYCLMIANIFGNIGGLVLCIIIPLVQSHILACQGLQTHHVTFRITDNKQSREEHIR